MPTEHVLTSKINARGGTALEKDAPTKRVKTSSTCSQSTTSRASGRPDVGAPADIGINQSLESAPPSPPVAQAFVPTASLPRACDGCVGGGDLGVSPTSTAAHISRNSISDIGIPDISAAGSAEDLFLLGARKARADKEVNETLTNKVQELQKRLGEKISELEQKNKDHEETMRQLNDQKEQLEKKEYAIEAIRATYKESNEIYTEMKRRHDILEEENGELKMQIVKTEASDDKTRREKKKLKQEVKSLKGDIVLKDNRIKELEKCLDRIARANRKNNREVQSVLGRRFLLEDTDDDEEYHALFTNGQQCRTCLQQRAIGKLIRPRAPADIGINQSLESAPPSPPVAQAFVPTASLPRACDGCVGGGDLGVSPTSTAAHISRNSISDIGIPDISAAGSAEDLFLLGARKARADKEVNETLTNKVQELQKRLGEKISELEQKNKDHEETMRQLNDQKEQLEKKEYAIEAIRATYKESNEIYTEMKRRHDILEEENGELKMQIVKTEASDDKTRREKKKLKQEVKSLKGDIVLKDNRIKELEKCLDRIARANRKNNREVQSVLGRRFLLEDTDDDEE